MAAMLGDVSSSPNALNQRFHAIRGVLADDRGASMIEYALLVALIAIIAIAAINLTGNEVSESFRDVASELR